MIFFAYFLILNNPLFVSYLKYFTIVKKKIIKLCDIFFYVNLVYNLNNQLLMKKVFLIVSIVLLGFGNVNAQET